MSRYSKEQIEQANNVDLVEYLQSHGYELTRESLQYKLAEHDSLYIRGNQWYWFSQGKGGKTLKVSIPARQVMIVDPATGKARTAAVRAPAPVKKPFGIGLMAWMRRSGLLAW